MEVAVAGEPLFPPRYLFEQTNGDPGVSIIGHVLRATQRFHRDERGQDLLEFVLLLPFVLFFIFVLIDFGIALDRYLIITHAAREGARYGAVGSSEAQIIQRAVDQSQTLLAGASTACPLGGGATACVDVTWNDGPNGNGSVGEAGDAVAVRVRYKYSFLNPFISWLPVSSITLGTCADSRLEVPPSAATNKSWNCSS